MDQQVLSKLLEEARSFRVIFGNRLANHLPMALIALHKMGADDERLRTFSKRYSRKLEPLSFSDSTPAKNPLESLGTREDFEGHLAYFHQRIDESDISTVLSEFLPSLMPGLSASAFHALIRLGYAIEIEDPEEVAYSLAYWSTEYQALGEIGSDSAASPIEILETCAEAISHRCFARGIIIDKMVDISNHEDYIKATTYPDSLTLETLSNLAIQAYLMTDNFTLLHGVTGLSAFKLLQPYLTDHKSALKYFWQAFLLAFLSTRENLGEPKSPHPDPIIWEPLLEKACRSNNDHVIKMVYTCWQEFQHSNNPDYFAAAEQVLRWDN